jgi:hypothetical protein
MQVKITSNTLGIFKKKTLFTCHSAILKDINFPKAHIGYEHILKVSSEDVKIYKAKCIMQSCVYGQVKG